MENNRGFSLVELMVVVAIIGILAAIGIPNFKRYQAKSKASEARIKLAAVYTAETNLQAEYDAFATCLNFAGYDPGGFNVSTYYAVGFSVPVGAANLMVVNNGGANCNVAPGNQTGFNGIKRVGNAPTPAMIMDIQQASPGNIGTALDGSTFMAGAIGPISPDVDNTNRANWSRWTINHNKQLVEQNPGY